MPEPIPRFNHRDPNQPEFWDERFVQQFTPWDQHGVPIELQQFVTHAVTPLSTLIPGCGVGHEVRYFIAAGWPVVAIDFSAAAVRAARHALDVDAACVVEADFFVFTSSEKIDFIYERAFLCSMPKTRWPEIVARWAQLLPVGGLLGGFFFFDAAANGPPFGADRGELAELMRPYFDLIEDRQAAQSITVFAGREWWQLWRRRE